MKKVFYIAALLGLIIGAGCQESQTTPKAESLETVITSENFTIIAGTQWTLQQMIINGKTLELVGNKPIIQFNADKNRVEGFASVNHFFGSVKIDDQGNVQWPGPFGSTRMAGPPEQMKQEDTFVKALSKTENFSKYGNLLYTASKDGEAILVFYIPAR